MFERFLECDAGFEFWNRYGRNLDFFRRLLRIDAHASGADASRERAESGNRYLSTFAQFIGCDFFKGLNEILRYFFRNAYLVREARREFCFVHRIIGVNILWSV